jgi:Flp pilus assembly protein TadG
MMKMLNELHGEDLARGCSQDCAAASGRAGVKARPPGERFHVRLAFGNRGQSMLELAFVFPLMLMVVTGIFAFSFAFYEKLQLEAGVDAGSRYLQIIRTSTSDPCADTLTAIENAAPSLNPSQIGLTLTMNGTAVNAKSCAGDQTDLVQGSLVTVLATYPCTLPIYGMTFASNCQLSAQVSEYEY